MHQSWMSSIQRKKVFSQNFGKNRVRPSRTAAIAFSAIGLTRPKPCSASVGFAHRRDRLLPHRLAPHEPLLREHRLDHRVASRAYADRVPMRLDLFEQAGGL